MDPLFRWEVRGATTMSIISITWPTYFVISYTLLTSLSRHRAGLVEKALSLLDQAFERQSRSDSIKHYSITLYSYSYSASSDYSLQFSYGTSTLDITLYLFSLDPTRYICSWKEGNHGRSHPSTYDTFQPSNLFSLVKKEKEKKKNRSRSVSR